MDVAKANLATLRDEHKAAEAMLRKTKKRTQQDVETVIGEYDSDLGAKEKEYQEVREGQLMGRWGARTRT